MKLIVFSDTHGQHRDLFFASTQQASVKPNYKPGYGGNLADLAVHCGDITLNGERDCIEDFFQWFGNLNVRHKVLVAGNHDRFAEQQPLVMQQLAKQHGCHYLCDTGVVLDGVNIWGSPITPRFMEWSFMEDAGEAIERRWRLIPDNTDLLVTHGPPFGILDELYGSAEDSRRVVRAGCPSLTKAIRRVQPAIHVFGHIHESYGTVQREGTCFVNASSMSMDYVLQNKPIELELNVKAEQTAKAKVIETTLV